MSVKSWGEENNVVKIKDDKEPKIYENFEDMNDKKIEGLRSSIEPWLSALFQSEHLSILLGSGFTSAIHHIAKNEPGANMTPMFFSNYNKELKREFVKSAERAQRGKPNIEDQIRVCNELIRGLKILYSQKSPEHKKTGDLQNELNEGIKDFANSVLESEKNIVQSKKEEVTYYLINFLMSFASRSATRERLNIFTTNYDRIIEFGAELAGLRLIDRFVGTLYPIFRSSRLRVDLHYNPPGIRGEPRYLEGVAYYTKLHGSIDWTIDGRFVRKFSLPLGTNKISPYSKNCESLMIYPNSDKDRETAEYPYVDLFRDFAATICYPNSTIVTYGYGFGDDHINRTIEDMLTIPSTHLVIIAYNDPGDRIKNFYNRTDRHAQMTLLIGPELGDIRKLVDNYLPKSAIDRTTIRMVELLRARGINIENEDSNRGRENESESD